MSPHHIGPRLFACLCFCAVCAPPARADIIRLKGGGEIRGELRAREKGGEAETIVIHTLTGGELSVARVEVEFVTRRSKVLEEYETFRKQTPHTLDDQWSLAEWCRERGLKKERETHLLAVLEFDSEHVAAHRGLGHVQHEGQWTTRDDLMTSQGYVKYRGRYVLPQELELIERNTAQTEAERVWFRKVYQWRGWLTGGRHEKALEARQALEAIDDPHAVPALVKSFRNEPLESARALFVALLSRLGGPKAFEALVYQSLHDSSATIRRMSLQGIPVDGRSVAIPFYINGLKNELNVVVLRAAAALSQLGDEQVVPQLIDALVTTHRYKVRVPEKNPTIGFSTDGQMGGGGIVLPPEIEAMLLTGQLPNGVLYQDLHPPPPNSGRVRTVVIKHTHQNREVLAALQKLTGEDYGYDERTWKLWWASQKASPPPTPQP